MAISLVSQTTGSSTSMAGVTVTIPATTSGSLLVVFFARSGGLSTGMLTSVTDSAGQTWTLATRGAASGVANTRLECWYVANSASITSVTFTSATAQINAWNISEWSGAAVSPLDVASPTSSAAAASTSIATPAVTTTADGDLVLVAAHHTQTTSALVASGFAALANYDYTTTGSGRAAYRVGVPVGSYSGAWTLGAAQAAGVVAVAFKAAPVTRGLMRARSEPATGMALAGRAAALMVPATSAAPTMTAGG